MAGKKYQQEGGPFDWNHAVVAPPSRRLTSSERPWAGLFRCARSAAFTPLHRPTTRTIRSRQTVPTRKRRKHRAPSGENSGSLECHFGVRIELPSHNPPRREPPRRRRSGNCLVPVLSSHFLPVIFRLVFLRVFRAPTGPPLRFRTTISLPISCGRENSRKSAAHIPWHSHCSPVQRRPQCADTRSQGHSIYSVAWSQFTL